MGHKKKHLINGEAVPSVTEVLNPFDKSWLEFFYRKHSTISVAMLEAWGVTEANGVDIANAFARESAERGQKYHDAAEAVFKDQTVSNGLNDEIARCIENLKLWRSKNKCATLLTEKHVENERYLYHGTLDLAVEFESMPLDVDYWGTPLTKTPRFIADHKTIDGRSPNDGEIKKHGMQQALYSLALSESGETLVFENGLLIYADMATSQIDIHGLNLVDYVGPALKQRDLWDFIKSKGQYRNFKKCA